ncbi:hypothetical protein NGRA_3037 [Nosema granulosis]|uniref:Uncharacterized protein n=1 Tax=Nosema granulosis TaxID=83296 RepID=A0A9P6GWK0_9MICR|nr:hypothetical protein NGRA_3037 [Nosema granulosis]
MLFLIYYFQCFKASKKIIQEYNFPVRIYKASSHLIAPPREYFYGYILEIQSTVLETFYIPDENIITVEDCSNPPGQNYIEATLILRHNGELNKSFIRGKCIRMAFQNNKNDIIISDLIYINSDGNLTPFLYTSYIELLSLINAFLTCKESFFYENLYCEKANLRFINKQICMISIDPNTKSFYEWKIFLERIISDGNSFDFEKYDNEIKNCIKYLTEMNSFSREYIERIRKYTRNDDFYKYFILQYETKT